MNRAGSNSWSVPAPEPGPGEVQVEVGACAICGSDFHLIDGHVRRAKYPRRAGP